MNSVRFGRRIYFDLSGNVLVVKGESQGFVNNTTIEQDIEIYKVLSERNPETFDVIELEYGQYAQDFTESNGYRVNPETLELEFSYPDPNEPEAPQEFRKPLSEEVEELKVAQSTTDSTLLDLMETVLLGGI